MADTYLENALKYLNHSDKNLVAKVIKCIKALFDRLQKESQFALMPHIREAIENAGVEMETAPAMMQREIIEDVLYKKKVEHLQIFRQEEGVKFMVQTA